MEAEKKLTGYPSIDKPWLKYYTEEAINAPLPEGSMYKYMYEKNKTKSNEIALNYFGRKINHEQLRTNIYKCENALKNLGVKSGDLIGLCLLTIPETVYLLYAINKLGAISNFLVLNATKEELNKQIGKSKIVITVDMAIDKIHAACEGTSVENIISISIFESMPTHIKMLSAFKKQSNNNSSIIRWKDFIKNAKQSNFNYAIVDSKDIATICYTGGTTGKSKGVLQTNQAGNSLAFHYIMENHFKKGDRFLDILPPFLAYGLYVGIHMPLSAGMEVILCPDPSPEKFPSLINKYKPNHFAGGPLHIDNMMADKKIQNMDLSFLRTAAYGGDKATDEWKNGVNDFLKKHNAPNHLQIGYGLTETAGTFCTTTAKQIQMIPFVNNNVRIVDVDTGKELPFDQEGEVYLSGPTIMLKYNDSNEQNNAIIEENGIRWFRTGDLGYVTRDGYFVISGRLKRVSWSRGDDGVVYRVYPQKIEEIIETSSYVHKCCVVNKADEKRGNIFIAFLVLSNNAKEKEAVNNSKELCNAELPVTSCPSEYYILESLPLTGAGKVDYRALEKQAENN